MSARKAALCALERMRRGGKWSDAAIAQAASGLDRRDAVLCARLCYGVLQNTELCDFYIDIYSSVKCVRMEPKILDILRISVYQILFLTKIPAHAAVNEAVALCRDSGMQRAAGLVNAVLRRISENRNALPEVPRNQGVDAYLSIRYSHPLPLVHALTEEYGAAFTEDFLRANNESAPICLQVNTLKTDTQKLLAAFTEKGIEAYGHSWLPDCIVLPAGEVAGLPGYSDGLFYVQDPAARLAAAAAGIKPGMHVLDACAAPGGKTFAAGLAMCGKGYIRSCDIQEKKLTRIADGAERLGLTIVETSKMDAKVPPAELREKFDLVLADVPCSGLGVIRKKPEIRRKPLSEIDALPEKQLAILQGLALCVKPGGVLLYSTCTIRKSENENVIGAFLGGNTAFLSEGFQLPAPDTSAGCGMVTLWPHIHGTDGFFICKLRKMR